MSYIKKVKKNGKVYLSEVESKRINGKVVTKHIRYIGKEADGNRIISTTISDLEVEQVKVYGPLIVLHHIAQEIGLSTILGEYGDEILSMVYAHCLNYESVNQMPDWFKRTDLNMMLDLEELTEHRLLMALDFLERQDPILLQKDIFEAVQRNYNVSNKGIIYDVTNTYFYGTKCRFAMTGKDKERIKGRPLIQIGLGVTQEEAIPVFHKIFHGNIHDSRTFQDMITLFRAYGVRHGVVIFDRGISSKQNQININELKWKVLCGLPIGINLKKILRATVKNKNFITLSNRVKLNKTIFYVEIVPHSIEGIKGKLAFCFNEHKSRTLKEARYDEIMHAKSMLSEGKKIKDGLEKFFDSNGKINIKKVKAAEELDGYSAIFTTTSLSKENIVKMYFDKDLVEKAFQTMKGITHLRPIRHWLYNRVIAHVFICYLSYLLLTILKIKLQKIEVTPLKALREIETLYKIYLKDKKKNFKFHKIVALNKKQEKIIKAVGKNLLSNCECRG